jgi:penicillin-binding protein 2
VDLGGERSGVVPTETWLSKHFKHPHWYDGDTVNMSIGQGYMQTTPLQMCDIAAMVANGGTIYKPHLVRQIRTDARSKEGLIQPEVIHHVDANPEFWNTVKDAMEGVIQEGTAAKSQIPGLVWAGKTGSAENGRKSAKNKTHSWFIGFAPADDPKIAFCVLVENKGQGADFAAPLAKGIVETYLAESTPAKAPVNTGPSASISAAKVVSPKRR